MENNERMDRVEATLERIGEKHEALAQTVELLATMHRELEQAMDRRTEQTDQRLNKILDSIAALVRIAENH